MFQFATSFILFLVEEPDFITFPTFFRQVKLPEKAHILDVDWFDLDIIEKAAKEHLKLQLPQEIEYNQTKVTEVPLHPPVAAAIELNHLADYIRDPKLFSKKTKKEEICKFFASSSGCWRGSSCLFLHPASNAITTEADQTWQPPIPAPQNPSTTFTVTFTNQPVYPQFLQPQKPEAQPTMEL